MASDDPALAKAIYAFTGHVTWSESPGNATPAILNLGKPLWNGELHNYVKGFDGELGLVEAFNEDYIRTKITRITTWNLCWSYYPVSNFPDVGMIRANTPWSGHYEVLPVTWGYAHINQFIAPGWRYLEKGGNGYLPSGGNYTCLKSPTGGEFSLIAQTRGATSPQTVQFRTVNGLSGSVLHVWRSTAEQQFFQSRDLTPKHGSFTITLEPDAVYTITTTSGQHKGGYPAPPGDAPLKLPYHDDYQGYKLGRQARYHYDYEGAFEIAAKTKGPGKCLRQAATKSELGWGGAYLPLTFLGSDEWKDYSVSANVFIEQAGAVSVHGRIGIIPDGNADDPPGYTLRIWDTGAWELKAFKSIKARGSAGFSANQWHNLRLDMRGSSIAGYVDGQQICNVVDASYASGLAGLGSGFNFAQFGDLEIK